jgi:ribose transport system substrate-binding protein
MRRLMLSAAAAALLAAPLAASAADYTFALVPKNVNNPFFDQARDGCKKAEAELNGEIECRYIGPGEHGGGEEQMQMVSDLIQSGIDGLAVSPSNAAAMASALTQAKAAGIPVLTWDSDLLPENADLRIAYVGTKNYDIGVNLAKIVQEIKPDGGTICIRAAPRRPTTTSACRASATRSVAWRAPPRPASG